MRDSVAGKHRSLKIFVRSPVAGPIISAVLRRKSHSHALQCRRLANFFRPATNNPQQGGCAPEIMHRASFLHKGRESVGLSNEKARQKRRAFEAERPRFELGIPFWSIHAFQACLLSHSSISPGLFPKIGTAKIGTFSYSAKKDSSTSLRMTKMHSGEPFSRPDSCP